MAAPAPGMKRSRKGKRKIVAHESGEDSAELRDDNDDDARPSLRDIGRRSNAGRGDAGEAGPSNAQHQAAPVQATADELAHLIRQRDFYKAEAENMDNPRISTEESDQLVAAVMRFMLFRQHQKPDQLVRREELSKLIQSTFKDGGKRGGNLGSYVIAHAQARLPIIFGLEMKLVEIAPASRAGGKGNAKGTEDGPRSKAYVLRSLLPEAMRSTFVSSASPDATPGFVLLVLSLINLAGGSISEDDLWRHLGNVGVEVKVPHPSLGQPEHQLELMLKKRYIVEQKQNSNEGPLKSYVLGENALDEIQANEIKDFVEGRLAVLEADDEED